MINLLIKFKQGIIESSSGLWRGDLQEQHGPFEAYGQAAYRDWVVCLAGKWAWLLAPCSFGSFSFPEGMPMAWARKRK